VYFGQVNLFGQVFVISHLGVHFVSGVSTIADGHRMSGGDGQAHDHHK